MKICANCGASLPDGAAFCINCKSKEFKSAFMPDLNIPEEEKPKIEYDQYGRPIGQFAQPEVEQPTIFADLSGNNYSGGFSDDFSQQQFDQPQYIEQYQPQYGQQQYQPQYGQQQYQPQYGQQQYQPQYGQQQYQPQYGQQQYQPQYGQQQYQPQYGQQQYQPQYGQQQYQPQYEQPQYQQEPQYEQPQYEQPQYQQEPQYEQPYQEEPQYEQPQYEQPYQEEPQYEQPQYEQPYQEEPQYEQPQYEQPPYQPEPQYQQPQQYTEPEPQPSQPLKLKKDPEPEEEEPKKHWAPPEEPSFDSKNFKFEKKEETEEEAAAREEAERPKNVKEWIAKFQDTKDYSYNFDANDFAAHKKHCILAALGITFWVPFAFCSNCQSARFYANQGLLTLIVEIIFGSIYSLFLNIISIAFVENAYEGWRLSIGGWIFGLLISVICLAIPVFIVYTSIQNIRAGKVKDIPFIGRLRLIA